MAWLKKDTSNCEQNRETKDSEYLNGEFRVSLIFLKKNSQILVIKFLPCHFNLVAEVEHLSIYLCDQYP